MRYLYTLCLFAMLGACQNTGKKQNVSDSINGSRQVAETTSGGFAFWDPDTDTVIGENAPNQCQLRVRTRYNIRVGAGTGHNRCGSEVITGRTSKGAQNRVVALGIAGSWVKFASPETRNCPGGFAFVHQSAFLSEDYGRYSNGECGPAAMDIRRNPQPAPAPTNSVKSKNGYSYPFVLDRCHGLKNGGGLGHYHAPRRSGGRRYRHGGTDYYAPKGTPLRSPCAGRVTTSHVGARAGNMVYVTCDNGTVFKYMHMHSSPRKARRGSRVSPGSVIGGVGNSGNARRQAPHVHLEVLIRGRRVNPQSLWHCGGASGH